MGILGPRMAPNARLPYYDMTAETMANFFRKSSEERDEIINGALELDKIKIPDIFYVPIDSSSLLSFIPDEDKKDLIYSTLCEVKIILRYIKGGNKLVQEKHKYESHILITKKGIVFHHLLEKTPMYIPWWHIEVFSQDIFKTMGGDFKLIRDPIYESNESFTERSKKFSKLISPLVYENKLKLNKEISQLEIELKEKKKARKQEKKKMKKLKKANEEMNNISSSDLITEDDNEEKFKELYLNILKGARNGAYEFVLKNCIEALELNPHDAKVQNFTIISLYALGKPDEGKKFEQQFKKSS